MARLLLQHKNFFLLQLLFLVFFHKQSKILWTVLSEYPKFTITSINMIRKIRIIGILIFPTFTVRSLDKKLLNQEDIIQYLWIVHGTMEKINHEIEKTSYMLNEDRPYKYVSKI